MRIGVVGREMHRHAFAIITLKRIQRWTQVTAHKKENVDLVTTRLARAIKKDVCGRSVAKGILIVQAVKEARVRKT